MDTISLLLFVAVLINQAGRVMVPSVMTSIMADPEFDLTVDARKEMLAGVSIVRSAWIKRDSPREQQLGWRPCAARLGASAGRHRLPRRCASLRTSRHPRAAVT